MSVNSVTTYSARVLRIDSEHREYAVTYRVETTDTQDGPLTALSGLPSIGTSYSLPTESDAAAFLVSYAGPELVSVDDTRKYWTCDATYSTKPRKHCSEDTAQSPLEQPPDRTFFTIRREAPAPDTDNNNQPIVNTANRPFDDLAMDANSWGIRIAINQATLHPEMDAFVNSVNSGQFYGLGPRKWKLDRVDGAMRFHGSCQTYFAMIYEFISNPKEWTLKPINQGFLDVNGALPKADGVAFRGVMPLDAAGEFLAANDNNVIAFDGNNNLNPFEVYEERDFTQLNIPTTF